MKVVLMVLLWLLASCSAGPLVDLPFLGDGDGGGDSTSANSGCVPCTGSTSSDSNSGGLVDFPVSDGGAVCCPGTQAGE